MKNGLWLMQKGAGFTLIELLIAMVLIGLMTGMAVLAMGNADRSEQQKLEAERLVMLLELAEQEATVRGEAIAVELFSEGYRFLAMKNGEWKAETADQLFKPRVLNTGMRLTLRLDDKPVYLNQRAGAAVTPEPQILSTPEGSPENFEIGIVQAGSDRLYVVANTAEEGVVMSSVAAEP